jgi:single-stranded-DNA-specific exonuclease
MRNRLWVFRDTDPELQMSLARALSISPVMASVLLARGVTDIQGASRWLSSADPFHDPFLLPDMEQAIDRLHRAAIGKERVCFYGDYDVDGMSATSLYVSFFEAIGGLGCAYIPHRLREGYGLNEAAIRALHHEGVTLIVTSDCGTTSHREIAAARRLGMDVIVTDHHQTDDKMPEALAVLNPHRADAVYPFKGLCSAGLAYKCVQAYCTKFEEPFAPESMLDLVALATVADIVPLHDENRIFVREGLAQISRGARCGIRALKQVAGITRECNSDTIAFRLAPRLNAAGRMDHALAGVQLLTTESDLEARQLAERLEVLNRSRQQIEEAIAREALSSVDESGEKAAVVVASRNWHLGVVGIVAARLVEQYHRPAIVIALDGQGLGKGSARTVAGFDLYQALARCRDLLVAFGGHPSAAGLTIEESKLPEFRERFSEITAAWIAGSGTAPTLHVDAQVHLSQVTLQLIQELESLHPFGAGNPEPTLAVRGLEVVETRVVGDKHLKLRVRQPNSWTFDSIGFRMGPFADLGLTPGRPIDLAFSPERNHWNGYDRIQLRIRALRASPEA